MGCKNIEIRKSKLVTKTQFLLNYGGNLNLAPVLNQTC